MSSRKTRIRAGFSLLELLVVLGIFGVLAATVIPSIGRSLGQTRVQRAATVIAADLKLAHATAARKRAPVRISIDSVTKVLRIRNVGGADTIYSQRYFGTNTEIPISRWFWSDTSVIVYPNGLAAGALGVRLWESTYGRTVTMTRVGLVRIQ